MHDCPAAGPALVALSAQLLCAIGASAAHAGPARPDWTAALAAAGVDVRAMDRGADPCADFYRFACGSWQKGAPVGADEAGHFAAFDGAEARFRTDVRRMLAESLRSPAQPGPLKTAAQWHARCAAGLAEPATTAALPDFAVPADMTGLGHWVGRLQAAGVHPFFRWAVDPDLRDGGRTVLWLDDPPLGLGDREAYLATDTAAGQLRADYLVHVRDVLAALGVVGAQEAAQAVIDLETRLATASKSATERRDATRMFHPLEAAALRALAPALPWDHWLAALKVPGGTQVIATSPKGLAAASEAWQALPLLDLASYVQWTVARQLAPLAGPGPAHLADRWARRVRGRPLPVAADRCLDATLQIHGRAVAAGWLDQRAGPGWDGEVSAVWGAVRAALAAQTAANPWLDAPARAVALGKVERLTLAPLLPPAWQVDPNAGVLAAQWSARGRRFSAELDLQGPKAAVAPGDWRSAEVGAFFDPQRNVVAVAPASLQGPLWPVTAAPAVRFGALGSALGHEAVHAIDREGGYFDGDGTLKPWWTSATAAGLATAATCLTEQLAREGVAPGLRPNPAVLAGELAADLGGLRAAHRALRQWVAPDVDPGAADRAFFAAHAQAWCAVLSPAAERDMAQRGPHPPPRLRVHAAVRNLPAFAAAFQCKAGAPLAPKTTCTIW
ncbi:MAG: M13 family metallopeptidase [Deltaproteobacteria bacterium]|nr:M13 family metallopeptidase [Deltaproteobacteria bacterium]